MYLSVCNVALIFLSLENVSGCRSWVKPQDSPVSEDPVHNKGTQYTCVHRYQNGNQQEAIAEEHITPEQSNYTLAHFIIKVEIFDINTEIYCKENGKNDAIINVPKPVSAKIGANQSVFDFSTSSNFNNRTILNVTNEAAIANEELAIFKYNETQKVLFNCSEHTSKTNFIQLGIINPVSNMIKTVPRMTLNEEFNKTHNGTILCCIYYVVSGEDERWVTRYVDSKTLLDYDDGHDNDVNDNRRQETLNPNGMSANENMTYTDTDPSSQYKKYVIATAAVGAVFILVVVIVIWKKRCRKKPKSGAKVLYADLDLLRQTAPGTSQKPSPGPEEESPYAQIIGEMRPQ